MNTAYLFATFLGGLVWLTFFGLRPDLRRVMLLMSAIGLPLALSDVFYVPQYWKPHTLGNVPVGIEGFLFSFEAAGICAVIYAAVFGKRPAGMDSSGSIASVGRPHLSVRNIIPIVAPLPVSALVAIGLNTNLEWGLYMGLVIACLLTVVNRPDLLRAEVFGALAFLPVYTAALLIWVAVFPEVHSWFTLRHMPHWYFARVPVEEIAFGALFAAFWTGLYPMVFERRFVAEQEAERVEQVASF
jgi:hypothetical protein